MSGGGGKQPLIINDGMNKRYAIINDKKYQILNDSGNELLLVSNDNEFKRILK